MDFKSISSANWDIGAISRFLYAGIGKPNWKESNKRKSTIWYILIVYRKQNYSCIVCSPQKSIRYIVFSFVFLILLYTINLNMSRVKMIYSNILHIAQITILIFMNITQCVINKNTLDKQNTRREYVFYTVANIFMR